MCVAVWETEGRELVNLVILVAYEKFAGKASVTHFDKYRRLDPYLVMPDPFHHVGGSGHRPLRKSEVSINGRLSGKRRRLSLNGRIKSNLIAPDLGVHFDKP